MSIPPQVWGLTWFKCHSRILQWWVQALCHLFFAFLNFFLMFLFRFFKFYFKFKCESPPNSVAYDWWRRQSYATLLDWTMGSGGLFCCVPLLALVCLGSGGWPMFRCVPLLASGTQPIVCRYWHRVVWDLGAVPLCAAIGIWNSTHCVPLLASGCLGSGGWPMFRCVPLLASAWNFGIWGLFFYFVLLLALPCAAVGLAKSQ